MNNLKALRNTKGIKITDVARAIGISAVAVGKHENGDIRTPGGDARKKYAKFYGVTEKEIFPDLSDSGVDDGFEDIMNRIADEAADKKIRHYFKELLSLSANDSLEGELSKISAFLGVEIVTIVGLKDRFFLNGMEFNLPKIAKTDNRRHVLTLAILNHICKTTTETVTLR